MLFVMAILSGCDRLPPETSENHHFTLDTDNHFTIDSGTETAIETGDTGTIPACQVQVNCRGYTDVYRCIQWCFIPTWSEDGFSFESFLGAEGTRFDWGQPVEMEWAVMTPNSTAVIGWADGYEEYWHLSPISAYPEDLRFNPNAGQPWTNDNGYSYQVVFQQDTD